MLKIKITFIILLSACFFMNADAQGRIVSGIVTTFDSIALIGINVQAKSTKQVVTTDSVGKFSITCSPDDVLTLKGQGFYTQKVKVTPTIKYAAINLKLKPGENNLEYSYGYFTVSDRDKLNAIEGLKNNGVNFSQYSSMIELIKGQFAGVQIMNGNIVIRGINSINGNNAALIILDGIQIDYSFLNSIPPSQVKSIDVIKDGSAAIYGSRGANGVVIIETRKGN